MNSVIKRGDVYFADLSPTVGSEQGGERPVLVIQNDIGNRFSPTVIVAAITAQISKAKLPTHISISAKYGFHKDSVILLEQIRTIDKERLKDKVTHIGPEVMKEVDEKLLISVGLVNCVSEKIKLRIREFIRRATILKYFKEYVTPDMLFAEIKE